MKSFFEKYLHNSIALCVALSITLNLIIETVSRRSFFNGLDYLVGSPMTFFYNSFIIFATLAVAFLVKRRIFVYIVVTLFWLTIGIINGVILGFRTTPFTVTDLSLLESGITIIPNYLTTPQIIMVAVAAILLLVALVLTFIFMPKHKAKIDFKKSIAGLFIIVITMAGATNLAISQNWVSTYFGNLGYAYHDYGFPYCFINTWLNTGISQPKNYAKEEILGIFAPGEIPENMNERPSSTDNIKKPNVIFLQLESFFDPTHVENFRFSEDPVPHFRELKERFSSGFLTVPSIGAGTANTEFEVLSGMSVRFFGPGEYPYKSVLKDHTVETMGYNLKNLGYATHAIHNHRGAFYGRNTVFANMGFDTFTSLEYMNYVAKTPKNWAKDDVLTGEILAALEATEEQDFIFTISVQGHGQYPSKQILKDLPITMTGLEDGSEKNAFEYYLQQIHQMDLFIKDLTTALENLQEDTVLVMYGDHLPSLNLSSADLINKDIYETEYVMWSNFPMKQVDKDLRSYQLGAETLGRLGIKQGAITTYHQNHSQDPKYLSNLKALQYDMLYGKQYIFGKTNPYAPTNLKMGVKDIKVGEIVLIGGKYYITGKNFTPFSKVSIGDKVLDTIFLGPSTLGLLEKVDPKDVTEMKVSQVEKNKEILSTTE